MKYGPGLKTFFNIGFWYREEERGKKISRIGKAQKVGLLRSFNVFSSSPSLSKRKSCYMDHLVKMKTS
jgi:hypothetical protein